MFKTNSMMRKARNEQIPVNPWFACFNPSAQASLRLFCFPYAGGGAMIFRRWAETLPSNVEVCALQQPGRGNRLRDTPFTDFTSLVQAVAREFTTYLDGPFAFFGHSLGAMMCFELARHLQKEHQVEPIHLFVSGRCAPQIPNIYPITYNLSEPEFIDELRRLNGTPKEVLEHPELMELMIPVLRADFELCQTYVYSPGPQLSCPITALGGLQDKDVTPEHLKAWRQHTIGPFSPRMLPGDHFFLHQSESMLLQIISQELYRAFSIPTRGGSV